MQMSKNEIHSRFKNMQGLEVDRIRVLAKLNACPEKYIKQILQEAESEPQNYHPDDNPHCKVEVELDPNAKGDIPEHVLDLIFDRLDTLDKEIKERQDEYNELVAYLGGKQ